MDYTNRKALPIWIGLIALFTAAALIHAQVNDDGEFTLEEFGYTGGSDDLGEDEDDEFTVTVVAGEVITETTEDEEFTLEVVIQPTSVVEESSAVLEWKRYGD